MFLLNKMIFISFLVAVLLSTFQCRPQIGELIPSLDYEDIIPANQDLIGSEVVLENDDSEAKSEIINQVTDNVTKSNVENGAQIVTEKAEENLKKSGSKNVTEKNLNDGRETATKNEKSTINAESVENHETEREIVNDEVGSVQHEAESAESAEAVNEVEGSAAGAIDGDQTTKTAKITLKEA